MIKQRYLNQNLLIPVILEASKFEDLTMKIASLPKDYTLISMNIEVEEGYGTGITANLGTKDESAKFANGIDINTKANIQSATQTTMKSTTDVYITLSAKPSASTGRLVVRIMLFAPTTTYMEHN